MLVLLSFYHPTASTWLSSSSRLTGGAVGLSHVHRSQEVAAAARAAAVASMTSADLPLSQLAASLDAAGGSVPGAGAGLLPTRRTIGGGPLTSEPLLSFGGLPAPAPVPVS